MDELIALLVCEDANGLEHWAKERESSGQSYKFLRAFALIQMSTQESLSDCCALMVDVLSHTNVIHAYLLLGKAETKLGLKEQAYSTYHRALIEFPNHPLLLARMQEIKELAPTVQVANNQSDLHLLNSQPSQKSGFQRHNYTSAPRFTDLPGYGKVRLCGYANQGLTCYLNSTLQCMKPLFLLAHKRTFQSPVIKSLNALFTNDQQHSWDLVSDVVKALSREPLFQNQCDIVHIRMEDAMNAARGLIDCYGKELPEFGNLFTLHIQKPAKCNCGMSLPAILKISYFVCAERESVQQHFAGLIQKHQRCPKPTCGLVFASKFELPKYIVVRCVTVEMTIRLLDAEYALVGVVRSSGIHACAYVRYKTTWFYFNDSKIDQLTSAPHDDAGFFVDSPPLFSCEGVLRGAYYMRID